MRRLARAAAFWGILSATPAYADAPTLQSAIGNPDDFKLSGSTRLRYEALDGQPRVGFRDEDEQLDLRSTLFAEYDTGVIRIGGEMYDSRAWLEKPGSAISANEVNTFELVQVYLAADVDNVLGDGSKGSLQAGRFTLNLGSRRLVAADDYRNTTNGYTGLRADLRTKSGVTATAIYVLPQIRLPDDLPSVLDAKTEWDRESFDLQLWGGLIAWPKTIAGATAEIGYFGLHERDWLDHPTRNRDLDTFSARLIRDPKAGQFDFEVEGIYQTGDIRASTAPNAAVLDVSAWFIHADAGYTFSGPAKFRLSVEYDRASGDGDGPGYNRFDTLFGMRRADLAPAGIYNAIGRANISTPGLRAELAPDPRWDAFAVYRPMWLASRTDSFSTTGVRDITGQSSNFAGHQLEGRVRYWLMPSFLRAEVNAVWLAKGEFLKTAPNAPQTGDTHYIATALMATF
ncbi:MAG: alginate export family protein [Porphyrobacter sp.]|nr:alginate export family protein [Porphyrobacter sp.]